MNDVQEDRTWWLELHFNLRRLLSGKKMNGRDFYNWKIHKLIEWKRRLNLAILTVNIWDLYANLLACLNSYSWDNKKKKALHSSCHEHIFRKNWAKPFHVVEKGTEVETHGHSFQSNRSTYFERLIVVYCLASISNWIILLWSVFNLVSN